MAAVAVLDRMPSREWLLERRLRAGWLPTASPLQAGSQILGVAADRCEPVADGALECCCR